MQYLAFYKMIIYDIKYILRVGGSYILLGFDYLLAPSTFYLQNMFALCYQNAVFLLLKEEQK